MWPLAVVWQGRILGAIVMALFVILAAVRLVVAALDRVVYAAQRLAD